MMPGVAAVTFDELVGFAQAPACLDGQEGEAQTQERL